MHAAAHDLLVRYALSHRDQRNITSHLIGVPLIVFSIGVLLSHPSIRLAGWVWTPAWVLFTVVAAWYLTRGALALGLATAGSTAALLYAAHRVADGGLASFLGWGVCTFLVGWLIQLVGHWYEGRKPAFLNDMTGLLVGPMFVTAEAMFAAGWNKPLQAEIERRAGPTMLRDLAKIA